MNMNKQWEKEWQDIDVPQEAVFQAIEKGLGHTEKVGTDNQRKKSDKLVTFIKDYRRLLVVAVVLLLVASAGIASISGNRSMKQMSTSADQAVTKEEKAVESPISESEIDGFEGERSASQERVEMKGKVDFGANEASDEAVTEANPQLETGTASPQKLVKTYDISKETAEFTQTNEGIAETVKKYEGYFSQSDIINRESEDQLRSATYTIRVPQEKVAEFIKELAKIGETISSSENATDYSLGYSDNQSRIKALQTEEEALLKLLGKSGTVQDMINIQDRLSQVRSSKESLIQQNKLIDSQVAETDIHLSVMEVKKMTKEKSTTVLSRAKDNWQDQLRFWQRAGQQLAVSFLSVGPYLVVAVVIAGLIWRVIKKRRA